MSLAAIRTTLAAAALVGTTSAQSASLDEIIRSVTDGLSTLSWVGTLDHIIASRDGAVAMATDGRATRIFAGPAQYPPAEFGAYGMVVFRSRAVDADRERYLFLCEAYVSAVPHTSELDLPRSEQLVTVWPMEADASADAANALAREATCSHAVQHYGLVAALEAIRHVGRAGYTLPEGRGGPYLIAWNPASSMGGEDALILQADLSYVRTPDQAKRAFEKWVADVEENTDLWRDGWNLEVLRTVIRNWADEFGPQVLVLFGE